MFEFDCGCKFEVDGESPLRVEPWVFDRPPVVLNLDVDKLNLQCPKVWNMLARGETRGVWQLEGSLGKHWSKRLKPENIEHLAALGALLRPGCISGDTNVAVRIYDTKTPSTINSKIRSKKVKIKYLYRQFVRNHHCFEGIIVSLNNNNELFNNQIKNVIYSGQKDVYKPILRVVRRNYVNKCFYNLECTLDHKLLTHNRGWVKLEDMQPGERFAVIRHSLDVTKPRKLFLGQRNFNNVCFTNYFYKCVLCDWNYGSLDVNHIVGNRTTNNHPDNLCFLCPNHHRMYTEGKISKELLLERKEKYRTQPSKHIWWAEYLGKEYIGCKDTYDITVEGPHHNFVAGNVVVHNCLESSTDDGVSLTEHYCRRKNGEEPVTYFHPSLESILDKTYGILCVHEDTEISTSTGKKPIKKIKIGELVYALNINTSCFELKECMGCGPTRRCGGIEVTLDTGNKVVLTSDHPVLTYNGYIKAQDLTLNTLVYIEPPKIKVGMHSCARIVSNLNQVYDQQFYGMSVKDFHNFVGNGIVLKNCYQEQSIKIAQKLCGFDLVEADQLRKSIGHKDPVLMSKIEKLFMDKAKTVGFVNESEAKEIFGWIRKGQRYSFNLCFSKDTTIRRTCLGNWFGLNNLTVEQMYRIRHDISYAKANGKLSLYEKWKSIGNYGQGLSLFDDGRIRPNVIKDIYYSGKVPVFKVTLQNGSAVECTINHKFPTPNGEKRLSELGLEDELYIGENGYPASTSRISEIDYVDIDDVYDVEMGAPYHNLVTGSNIVASNSHAISYGLLTFITAYTRAHFTIEFLTSYLRSARKKAKPLEEIRGLVNSARTLGYEVLPPDFCNLEPYFTTNGKNITFGLSDIKRVSKAEVNSLRGVVTEIEQRVGKPHDKWSWLEFLVYCNNYISASTMKGFIEVGALHFTGLPRTRMLYEYNNIWSNLTGREIDFIAKKLDSYTTLHDAVTDLTSIRSPKQGGITPRRRNAICSLVSGMDNPSAKLEDTPDRIAYTEENFLGLPLTCSHINSCDICDANTTCKEFLSGKNGYMLLAVDVQSIREVQTKKGKNPGQMMAFLTVGDNTSVMEDVMITPQLWKENKGIIKQGATLLIRGKRDKLRSETFIVEKVWPLRKQIEEN